MQINDALAGLRAAAHGGTTHERGRAVGAALRCAEPVVRDYLLDMFGLDLGILSPKEAEDLANAGTYANASQALLLAAKWQASVMRARAAHGKAPQATKEAAVQRAILGLWGEDAPPTDPQWLVKGAACGLGVRVPDGWPYTFIEAQRLYHVGRSEWVAWVVRLQLKRQDGDLPVTSLKLGHTLRAALYAGSGGGAAPPTVNQVAQLRAAVAVSREIDAARGGWLSARLALPDKASSLQERQRLARLLRRGEEV